MFDQTKRPPAEPASPAPGTPPPSTASLPDATIIGFFRTADAKAYAQLNHDHGLSFTEDAFRYLQAYYKDTAHRDPTLGEIRVLHALTRVPDDGEVGHRHAVGELLTDSPILAETWADMMQKHAALSAAAGDTALPPCTYEDALTLPARYLWRTGRRTVEPPRPRRGEAPVPTRLLVQTPAQEMEAIARGFSLTAAVRLSDGRVVSVATRRGDPGRVIPPRKGEILLYAPQVTAAVLHAFMETQRAMPTPDANEVRVVTRRSILETAAEMTEGAELHAHAFLPANLWSALQKIPVDHLCGMPRITEACADVLIRTSVGRASYLVADLGRRGVQAVAVGQVSRNARITLRLQNTTPTWNAVVADLRLGLLFAMQTVRAHACHPTLSESTSAPVTGPFVARLPGATSPEDGITPSGSEVVALTAHTAPVMFLREERLGLATATATVVSPGDGYAAARQAADITIQALTVVAPDAGGITLSASLLVKRAAGDPIAHHDRLSEVICGLYRACAEQGIPLVDPALVFAPTAAAEASVEVLVVARTEVDAQIGEDDRQWSPAASLSATPTPLFLLPNLRRSAEGSLRALSNALGRRTAVDCIIQPVVIDTFERPLEWYEAPAEDVCPSTEETPAPGAEGGVETDTDSPTETLPPPTKICEVVNQTSAEKLIAMAGEDAIPLFAMSEIDARLLLATPSIRAYIDARLESGKTVIVVGEACFAFAARGYLPDEIAYPDRWGYAETARVNYHGILAEKAPATRLPRRPLCLSTAEYHPHLLTLTLPDGTTVPDGFVACDGYLLGLTAGVDATVETILRAPRFGTPPPDDADTPPTPVPPINPHI